MQAPRLIGIAVAGQVLGYLLSVVLARRLGLAGFEAYVVASAAFILLATFAARGSEKYALLHLPTLLQRGDWTFARGLIVFGIRRTLCTALVSALALAAWNWWTRDPGDEVRLALFATCLSLPAGALMHYGVEALSAAGRPLQALAIFKLFVPATALLLVAMMLLSPLPMRGAGAIACWGIAWVVALGLTARALRRALPTPLFRARALQDTENWRAATRPFFVYRVAMALLGQTGVIALDLLQPSPVAVGAYAAAAGTAGVVAVLATSTNRVYGRELALLIEARDFDGLLVARRARLRWLVPVVLICLILTFAFSRQILAPYGPTFAEEGVPALRLVAVATGFTILFALAPTWLKARRHDQTTYTIVAIAALAQLTLLVILVPPFGATGAALAYAVSMCGMYGAFAVIAWREAVTLRAQG